jgi:hypothetical protein
MKRKVMMALIYILISSECQMPLHFKADESSNGVDFLLSYRYQTRPYEPRAAYREYEVFLMTIYSLYMDFTSMGINHFSMDWVGYLDHLISRKKWMPVFLELADRMTRNMAFVPGLYETDIHSGKAIDFTEDMKEK